MSQRLQKHKEFTVEKKRKLFRTSFLTARKQHASTQSDTESETFTKKSIRKFDEEFLFNTSTESSNMIMMNFFQQKQDESLRFQESLKSEKFQEELRFQANSKSKSSSSEMILQQWCEFKMMKIRLEMMKLEI